MRFNILFLGTSSFAVPILERLHKDHEVKLVITQPDKPVGRKQTLSPPPVKTTAVELGLRVEQPENARIIPSLITDRIDFLVTASYGQYLPTKVLEIPFKDALNVHPSLLPKYRGATPMQSALLNGDDKTGVTIMRMVKEMDAGPLFNQIQFPLEKELRYLDLEKKCSELGAELVASVIKNHNSLSPQPQDESKVTYCKKLTKTDGEIHFGTESSTQMVNKLRAFTPWPGVYTWWKEQKLNLLDFKNTLKDNQKDLPSGLVYHQEGKIFIKCKEGSIELLELQLSGKNPTPIQAFINGHQDFIGTKINNHSH